MGLSSEDPFSYVASTERLWQDFLEPTTLVLKDQYIAPETEPTNWLYQIGQDVTAIPQKATSIAFEKIENNEPVEVDSSTSTRSQNRHLFYLAHPLGARYRTDIPPYYLTSVSSDTLGNISLETSKSRLGKYAFKVLVSSGRSWTDNPLFHENAELLFNVKQKWANGHYIWADSNNKQVAYEDDKYNQHRLVITASMKADFRDALVAAWCLKLWHDTSESSQAKSKYMESLTPPEEMLSNRGIRSMNSIAGHGNLAGLA
ncbi:hypothetical protein F5Y00DRAFT_221116 [Daldinia vernicosa]|uniref:uncharacterized protein n=1 Tax=Daldinia vernicosa TaxID=114800 RepID=UPI0020072BF8|nr:uncharacterized protein F5Y00DRAFT_221116 [Daldinia vernicosa]KAI0843903.1 hypothetical protein F5Y00DRAFT_221116 [Daldinia vernicosa]